MTSVSRAALFSVLFGLGIGVSHANSDGAPWGSADPNAAQSCASCHFDRPVVTNSKAIEMVWPNEVAPYSIYIVPLNFKNETGAKAGFMMTANVGKFGPADATLEAYGSHIRSLEPKSGNEVTSWEFIWMSPGELPPEIIFHIAVNAGNDDQSSFGDEIHFKTFIVKAESND